MNPRYNTAFFLIALFLLSSCQNPAKIYIAGDDLIVTPPPKAHPRINGPSVYGCRPGNPFLYRIPCQGIRPVNFSAEGLPEGLKLDPVTGIITGTAPPEGKYEILLEARNSSGKDKKSFIIEAGDKLALTPPMGWNHWYAHYNRITDAMMREAADIMISSGMADVGYNYVNIDDCWMNAPEYEDTTRLGPLRNEEGNIVPNSNFPDMKALTSYIHDLGLKAGIYTSPGPLTCARFAGSYGHEAQDAQQFAEWGFDFLKYDWCSYGEIAVKANPGQKEIPLATYKYPYQMMGDILKKQNRDIVYNLCQYGMGAVWEWGGEVGGNCWRTAGDLGFELDRVFEVALKNSEYRQYSKPGEWNDPDYIQIGWIGTARKMGLPEKIQMPSTMQYSYMSLWSLMAAPLIYSGDMTKLDDFTLNILCNPEIIEVNQDPLGESGLVIKKNDEHFVMIKNLHDGSSAVGLFNRAESPADISIEFDELGIDVRTPVRDLWRQKYLGKYKGSFKATVPSKGVVMVKIG
jgi:alpha-galactosidase